MSSPERAHVRIGENPLICGNQVQSVEPGCGHQKTIHGIGWFGIFAFCALWWLHHQEWQAECFNQMPRVARPLCYLAEGGHNQSARSPK
jgi:hypothetical protein